MTVLNLSELTVCCCAEGGSVGCVEGRDDGRLLSWALGLAPGCELGNPVGRIVGELTVLNLAELTVCCKAAQKVGQWAALKVVTMVGCLVGHWVSKTAETGGDRLRAWQSCGTHCGLP